MLASLVNLASRKWDYLIKYNQSDEANILYEVSELLSGLNKPS